MLAAHRYQPGPLTEINVGRLFPSQVQFLYIQGWISLLSIAKTVIFPFHLSHHQYADSDHWQPMRLLHFERRNLVDFPIMCSVYLFGSSVGKPLRRPVTGLQVIVTGQFGSLDSSILRVTAPTPYGSGGPMGNTGRGMADKDFYEP